MLEIPCKGIYVSANLTQVSTFEYRTAVTIRRLSIQVFIFMAKKLCLKCGRRLKKGERDFCLDCLLKDFKKKITPKSFPQPNPIDKAS